MWCLIYCNWVFEQFILLQSVLLFSCNRGYLISASVISLVYDLGFFFLMKLIFWVFQVLKEPPALNLGANRTFQLEGKRQEVWCYSKWSQILAEAGVYASHKEHILASIRNRYDPLEEENHEEPEDPPRETENLCIMFDEETPSEVEIEEHQRDPTYTLEDEKNKIGGFAWCTKCFPWIKWPRVYGSHRISVSDDCHYSSFPYHSTIGSTTSVNAASTSCSSIFSHILSQFEHEYDYPLVVHLVALKVLLYLKGILPLLRVE